jgi:hypothetical protein
MKQAWLNNNTIKIEREMTKHPFIDVPMTRNGNTLVKFTYLLLISPTMYLFHIWLTVVISALIVIPLHASSKTQFNQQSWLLCFHWLHSRILTVPNLLRNVREAKLAKSNVYCVICDNYWLLYQIMHDPYGYGLRMNMMPSSSIYGIKNSVTVME